MRFSNTTIHHIIPCKIVPEELMVKSAKASMKEYAKVCLPMCITGSYKRHMYLKLVSVHLQVHFSELWIKHNVFQHVTPADEVSSVQYTELIIRGQLCILKSFEIAFNNTSLGNLTTIGASDNLVRKRILKIYQFITLLALCEGPHRAINAETFSCHDVKLVSSVLEYCKYEP